MSWTDKVRKRREERSSADSQRLREDRRADLERQRRLRQEDIKRYYRQRKMVDKADETRRLKDPEERFEPRPFTGIEDLDS